MRQLRNENYQEWRSIEGWVREERNKAVVNLFLITVFIYNTISTRKMVLRAVEIKETCFNGSIYEVTQSYCSELINKLWEYKLLSISTYMSYIYIVSFWEWFCVIQFCLHQKLNYWRKPGLVASVCL